ncbi:MAG: hypothetical protein IJ496_08470 [Ruminococcus sp.]|nr:hypothetical protein [Ruminococcus sp.]
MKTFCKMMTMLTACMTAAAMWPVSTASLVYAEETFYPSTWSEYTALLETYPESYRVDTDSVYFMWDNSTYLIGAQSSFSSEHSTYGYIFRPEEDGTYVVSALEWCEQIVEFTILDENDSHYHYFYPHIRNYTVTVKNGEISVRKDGERNYIKDADVDAYIQETKDQMYATAEETSSVIGPICADYAPFSMEDVVNEGYYAYVNTRLPEEYFFICTDYEYEEDTVQFGITTDWDGCITVSDTEVAEIELSSTCASWMDGGLKETTPDIRNFCLLSPVEDGTVDVTASDSDSYEVYTLTASSGRFLLPAVESGGTEAQPGDLTWDGKVNMGDAVILQKHLLTQRALSAAEKAAADVNSDGRINVFDMILLKEILRDQGNTSELSPVTRIDITKAVTWQGWNAALIDIPFVITSPEQLDNTITPFFRDAVVRSLKTTYDEAFFEQNVLFLDLRPAHAYDDAVVIDDVFYQNGDLQIEYAYMETNCVYPEGTEYEEYVLISQVSLPREQYHENEVVWSVQGTEEIHGTYHSMGLSDISYLCGDEAVDWDSFNDWREGEGVCITSFQELTEILSGFMTEKGVAFFQDMYPESFFKAKVLYLYPEAEFEGTEKYAWNITKSGDLITVDVKRTEGGGCLVDDFLGQLTLDKETARNARIGFRTFTPGDGMDRGDLLYYEVPNECDVAADYCPSALAVHQYSFLGESNIDFYWCYPTGMDLFGDIAVLECAETESGFLPFDDQTYNWTADSDGNIVYAGSHYEIIFKTDGAEVRVRTSEQSDAYEAFYFPYS